MAQSFSLNTDLTTFGNDSYLIIVWGDKSEDVKILDYDDIKKQESENILNKQLDLKNIPGLDSAAGFFSEISKNFGSKGLESAVGGRLTSSIQNIMSDGIIGTQEVAEDLINNCTNELDLAAIEMGYATPSALYQAIVPGGAGVDPASFLNAFRNSSEAYSGQIVNLKNEEKDTLSVVKIDYISDDTEGYESEVPERRVEKGFTYTDYVYNSILDKDFNCILGGQDKNPFDYKDVLKKIRASKKPFDVYVNDSKNQVQEVFKNCLFTSLNFKRTSELGNTINCSMSMKPATETEIESVSVERRVISAAKSSIEKNSKTKESEEKSKQPFMDFRQSQRELRDRAQAELQAKKEALGIS